MAVLESLLEAHNAAVDKRKAGMMFLQESLLSVVGVLTECEATRDELSETAKVLAGKTAEIRCACLARTPATVSGALSMAVFRALAVRLCRLHFCERAAGLVVWLMYLG